MNVANIDIPRRLRLGAFCKHWHVRELALFGSVLRDDVWPRASDIDVSDPVRIRADIPGVLVHRSNGTGVERIVRPPGGPCHSGRRREQSQLYPAQGRFWIRRGWCMPRADAAYLLDMWVSRA